MTLGQQLKQARQEAGLSQRALCGDVITRNMLSQIENGTAKPSMDTLRYLAQRLGKSVGWFLDDAPDKMEQARTAYLEGRYADAIDVMSTDTAPDAVLLTALCRIALAEQAVAQGRLPYAVSLLEQAEAGKASPYYDASLERRRLLALAQAKGRGIDLPIDDRELLIRAKAALDRDDPHRAAQYLTAAEDLASPHWQYLRGEAYFAAGAYGDAADCYRAALDTFPKACAARLEACCRELEDFKGAYEYACMLREL